MRQSFVTMDSASTATTAAAAVASGDAKTLDKNTLVAVLQFLNKNSLQVCAQMLKCFTLNPDWKKYTMLDASDTL